MYAHARSATKATARLWLNRMTTIRLILAEYNAAVANNAIPARSDVAFRSLVTAASSCFDTAALAACCSGDGAAVAFVPCEKQPQCHTLCHTQRLQAQFVGLLM